MSNKQNIKATPTLLGSMKCTFAGCTNNTVFANISELRKHIKWNHSHVPTSYMCGLDRSASHYLRELGANVDSDKLPLYNDIRIICPRMGDRLKTIRRGDIINHECVVHDIGINRCNLCKQYKYFMIQYSIVMCRDCFRLTTDKKSMGELRMSDYLDDVRLLVPFLVDLAWALPIGGQSAISSLDKYPDKAYVNSHTIVFVECDNNQLPKNETGPSYDDSWIEPARGMFPEKRLIMVRFNPDGYTPVNGLMTPFHIRLLELKKLIVRIMLSGFDTSLYDVYYMYYTCVNPMIKTDEKYAILQ